MNSPDSTSLPERSSAWNGVSERPSQGTVDAAVQATLDHELVTRARQYEYCHAVVMIEPKEFIERCNFDKSTKLSIQSRLTDTTNVTLVSYHTSETQPEPLSGAGKTFEFILHPTKLQILYADTSTWRS